MGTAKSGYIQRKIVKVCEDIQIQYDNTVRDATGKIYQFSYGENDFDCTKTIKVNDIPSSCNITRLAERLNLNFENDIKEEPSELFPETKIRKEEKQWDESESENKSQTEIEDSETEIEDEIDETEEETEEENSDEDINNLLEENDEEDLEEQEDLNEDDLSEEELEEELEQEDLDDIDDFLED